MPATFNEIGVKCVTAALVESVDVQKQHERVKLSEKLSEKPVAVCFDVSQAVDCVSVASIEQPDGGQGGIRTLGNIAATHAFQACSFDHSDTCPWRAGR